MLIIRGKIENAEDGISLTCCHTTGDVLVGGKSLYEILDDFYGLDRYEEDQYENEVEQLDDKLTCSYLILKEDPGTIIDYDSFIGEWVIKKIYSEYVYGCYSQWTCGSGGHEYFIGKNGEGHDIYQELGSHIGDYLILKIDDHRDLVINSILDEE